MLFIVVPLIYGFFIPKSLNKQLQIILAFLFVNFLFSIISILPIKSWFGLDSNMFVFYIMAFTNVLLKYFIYNNLIKFKKLVLYSSILSLISIQVFLIILRYNFTSVSASMVTEGFFSILVSFLYLSNLHKTFLGDSLRKEPMFWISIGFLISGIFNIMLYSFNQNLYLYSADLFKLVWTLFTPITETTVHILITIGFYFARKSRVN